jgi:2-C-methyl-D-erythritol 4-phosphate cytidylyltransferase
MSTDQGALPGMVSVIVPAAGSGQRLGASTPKALVDLAGQPLLTHAVRSVLAGGLVHQVVLVAPAGLESEVERAARAAAGQVPTVVVTGGATRDLSVAAGLAAVDPRAQFVLVHDAARALVPAHVIADVVAALRAGAPAVVPGMPVADTIREVAPDGSSRTLERANLRAVQTPQGFPVAVLRAAHARRAELAGLAVTDDAGLVEAFGDPVTIVAGHAEAMKVTTPADLALAEVILAARARRADHTEGGAPE